MNGCRCRHAANGRRTNDHSPPYRSSEPSLRLRGCLEYTVCFFFSILKALESLHQDVSSRFESPTVTPDPSTDVPMFRYRPDSLDHCLISCAQRLMSEAFFLGFFLNLIWRILFLFWKVFLPPLVFLLFHLLPLNLSASSKLNTQLDATQTQTLAERPHT